MIAKVMAFLLVISLVLGCAGYLLYAFAAEQDDEALARARLESLPRVLEIITENYRDQKNLLELVNAAYEGVFDTLDEWSEYFSSREQQDAFSSYIDPSYSGIGVTLEQSAAGARIAKVNPFGPAFEAGVPAGALVRSIDGKDLSTTPATEVAALMRGNAGTTLTLVVDFGGQEKRFTITRKTIPDSMVYSELLEGDIAYLQVQKIGELTDAEFLLAHTDLLNKGARALILDLRGCPGGYMEQAARIAEELMPAGVISNYVQQGKAVMTLYAEGTELRQVPTVVLIDEETASAAEMITGALQDCGAATVVGTVSFGKGVAQGVIQLPNEDSMKLSTVYFNTPKGRVIEGNGLRPDHIVYNGYYYSADRIAALTKGVIAMDEGVRYAAGQSGRNVLAAQQRLKLLGYDVDTNSVMDARTVEAVRDVQRVGGGSPYGGLDFGTMAMIEARYKALCTPGAGDLQLAKALELLKP